jgi:hypothetical protein
MTEELDDLTLVYMYGLKNGKDSLKDEIERLLLIEQGAAEPCDTCGWRMKFPNAECRNCENAKLRDEIKRLRAALQAIAQCPIPARLPGRVELWSLAVQMQETAIAALREATDDAAP